MTGDDGGVGEGEGAEAGRGDAGDGDVAVHAEGDVNAAVVGEGARVGEGMVESLAGTDVAGVPGFELAGV